MFYGSRKSLLDSSVRRLKSVEPQNEVSWPAQTELMPVVNALLIKKRNKQ